ncbi:hypothetical protein HDU67_007289 [Dinochytrium kinnereticum]|nr:hypothetical protein HDU67_007289 [Dinochytrium kinnereticum]
MKQECGSTAQSQKATPRQMDRRTRWKKERADWSFPSLSASRPRVQLNLAVVRRLVAQEVVASTTPVSGSFSLAGDFPTPRGSVSGAASAAASGGGGSGGGGGGGGGGNSKTATMTASRLRTNASLILSLERTARNPEGWLDELVPHAKNILFPPPLFWSEALLDMDDDAIERILVDGFLRKASLASLALSVAPSPSSPSASSAVRTVGNASTLATLALTAANRDRMLVLASFLERRAEAEAAAAAAAAREREVRSRIVSEPSGIDSGECGWGGSRRVTGSTSLTWSAPLPRGSGRACSTHSASDGAPVPSGGSKTWGGFFGGGGETPAPAPPSSSREWMSSSPTPSYSSSPLSSTSSFPSWSSRPPASSSSSRRQSSARDEDPVLAETTTVERIMGTLLPTDRRLASLFGHLPDLRRLVFHERCATAAADAVLRVAVLNCGVQLRQIAIVGRAPTMPEEAGGGGGGGGVRFTRLAFQNIWWSCPNLVELRVERREPVVSALETVDPSETKASEADAQGLRDA